MDPGVEAEVLIRDNAPLMLLEISSGLRAGMKVDKLLGILLPQRSGEA
jgi:hypothetical protein